MIKTLKPKKEVIKEVTTEEDVHWVHDQKVQDNLNLQKEYRNIFWKRVLKQKELDEIKKQIDEDKVTMLWLGIPMSKDFAETMFRSIYFTEYRDLVDREVYLFKGLQKNGCTQEDIDLIIRGQFKKDIIGKDNSEIKIETDKMNYMG